MIVLSFSHTLEFNEQASGVQEPHSVRTNDKILVDDGFGFSLFSVKDQLTDFVKPGKGTGAVVVVGAAAPEGFLIELDFLFLDTSIDHSSHIGVA